MIDFVKQRIQSIIELKKERHFIPGMMLGSYAIVILATVMSIWSFMFLGKLDNPFFNGLLPVASLFFPFYVAALTILAGKEIIWCHMMIFKQTDNLFRKMIDKLYPFFIFYFWMICYKSIFNTFYFIYVSISILDTPSGV